MGKEGIIEIVLKLQVGVYCRIEIVLRVIWTYFPKKIIH